MSTSHESPPSNRFRSMLDVLATVMVIAAAGAVLALAVSRLLKPEGARDPIQSSRTAPLSLTPPSQPQSILASPTIGSPNATLAVIEYSDFQCPYCGTYVRDVWPSIKSQYVDSGKVKFAFKNMPLGLHPHARNAALAAACADRQGRFGDMHDFLFATGDQLSSSSGLDGARRLGLNVPAFEHCVSGTESAARVDSDIHSATAIGVVATPWFLVGKVLDDGRVNVTRVFVGMTPFEAFKTAFEQLNGRVEGAE